MIQICGFIGFYPNIPFLAYKLSPESSKKYTPRLVATAKVVLAPAYPSKTGSDPHLFCPIKAAVSALKA